MKTIDKIKHYLGEQISNHILGLNLEQAKKMLSECYLDLKFLEMQPETFADKNALIFTRKNEIELLEYLTN